MYPGTSRLERKDQDVPRYFKTGEEGSACTQVLQDWRGRNQHIPRCFETEEEGEEERTEGKDQLVLMRCESGEEESACAHAL
jgi:hypothetical protein